MRGLKVFFIGFVLVAMLALGTAPAVHGQDNAVTCDSDLTLLWYIAERYFAFGAVQNSLVQTAVDPATVLDLDRFNRGQFTPLFDALRSAQDPNTLTLPGVSLTQDWLNAVLATMLMDETSFQDFLNSMQVDPNAITPLVPATVAGEAADCALLRSQLQRFFAAVTFQDLQTGFTPSVGANANLNANVNNNANVNANDNVDNANANANANDNGSNVNSDGGFGGDNNANANVNANDNTGDQNANVNDNTNTNTNDNVDDNGNDNGDDDDGGNSGSGGGGDDDGSGNSGSGGDDGGGNSGSGGGGDDDGGGNSGSGGGNGGSGSGG